MKVRSSRGALQQDDPVVFSHMSSQWDHPVDKEMKQVFFSQETCLAGSHPIE